MSKTLEQFDRMSLSVLAARVLPHWLTAILCASVSAQRTPGTASLDEQTLTKLANPRDRDAAIADLDRIGPLAVRQLIAAVDLDRPSQARPLLFAIAELAHHAAPEYERIVHMADGGPTDLQADVFALRVVVIPFLPAAEVSKSVAQAGGDGMDVVLGKDAAAQQRFVQAIFQVSEFSLPGTRLGADVAVEDLVVTLQQRGDDWLYRRLAAARLLGLRGPSAASAAPALLECMRPPVARPERTYSLQHWGLGQVRCSIGPENHRWHARALTQIVPGTEAAMEAHGYLARYGTPPEFAAAIDALRLHATKASAAVPHLIAIIQDRKTAPREAAAILETVTTLGILGDIAKKAQSTLEEVAAGSDPHLAARAVDALRRIAK